MEKNKMKNKKDNTKLNPPKYPELFPKPIEPIKPEEFIWVYHDTVDISDTADVASVEISLNDLNEMASKYKKDDMKINLYVRSCLSTYDDSEIEVVQLRVYKKKINKEFDKQLKKYNKELELFNLKIKEYLEKEKLYYEEHTEYQLYRLEESKKHIESQIEKIKKEKVK